MTIKKDMNHDKSGDNDKIEFKTAKAVYNNISEENLINAKNNKNNDFDNFPALTLKEIEGTMMNGEIVEFNNFGMKGGLRNQRDGVAYFGYVKNNSTNDFILTNTNNNVIETDPLFKIAYNYGKKNF